MMVGLRVDGLEATLKSLNREIKRVPLRTHQGMIKAGFKIRREAQIRVPVDTANLKASAYVVYDKNKVIRMVADLESSAPSFRGLGKNSKNIDTAKLRQDHINTIAQVTAEVSGRKTVVFVGFTAEYAIFVHEDEEAHHAEGKGAKFLQDAVTQNWSSIIRLIREESKA